MENMTEKAMEFIAKTEAAAPAAEAPAPAPEAKPVPQPQPDVHVAASPEAVDETIAANEDKIKPPSDVAEQQPGESKAAFEKRILKAVIGGQLREIDEDTLIKLADRGYDYDQKQRHLMEEAQKLEALIREVQPYKEEIDKRKAQESEEEEADPFVRLQKDQERTRAELEQLKKEREVVARTSAQREAVERLNSAVDAEKAKHDILNGLPESVQRKVMTNIYGAIAFYGKSPERAVADEVADLKAMMSTTTQERAKQAISKAKTPPVPGRGAPPTVPAVKLDRNSLYNGKAYEAAMELIKARESR